MEKDSQIKVSVIIPVYNAEDYIHQCLDSLLQQTLKEFEIICIDDGSTDKSLQIMRDYENMDSRIIVKCQSNKGAGTARNFGLQFAKGEYLLFLNNDVRCLDIIARSRRHGEGDLPFTNTFRNVARRNVGIHFHLNIIDRELSPRSTYCSKHQGGYNCQNMYIVFEKNYY